MSIKKSAEVSSARKNKQDPVTKDWIAPDGTNLGPKGKKTRVKVGNVNYVEYETTEEAQRALTDAVCLKFINAQVETNAKNTARAEAVGVPSDKTLRNDAFVRLATTTEGQAALAGCIGDQPKLDALVEETMAALRIERGISAVGTENDDEDEAEILANNV